MNEHQEESEHASPATSEKENRTASQGTEASQPATSLDEEPEIADYGPLPSKAQMQYHREELAAFIHFGMNTYYDRESVSYTHLMDSKVYVNGQFVGHYPNGYNAFSYDITPYLNADGSENTIAVHVVNQQPSSRWYSGSGTVSYTHLDVYKRQTVFCLIQTVPSLTR